MVVHMFDCGSWILICGKLLVFLVKAVFFLARHLWCFKCASIGLWLLIFIHNQMRYCTVLQLIPELPLYYWKKFMLFCESEKFTYSTYFPPYEW